MASGAGGNKGRSTSFVNTFTPSFAVHALDQLGFKSSFGSLKFSKFQKSLFPLIALEKSGKAIYCKSFTDDGEIIAIEPGSQNTEFKITKKDYSSRFSGFVLLAKALSKREQKERSGHWFFSSFRRSKWLYVQVMLAAMVSSFLSLTTSLFTMTVYDRIIPNGAFESLIALSIGVIIALAFDFLIKGLRARFIDTASKRADLEISRKLLTEF